MNQEVLTRRKKQNYYWWPENWPMFLFVVALNFLVLALIVKGCPRHLCSSLSTAIFSPSRTSRSNQNTETQSEREKKGEIRWASIHEHAASKTHNMVLTSHASILRLRFHWDFPLLLFAFPIEIIWLICVLITTTF